MDHDARARSSSRTTPSAARARSRDLACRHLHGVSTLLRHARRPARGVRLRRRRRGVGALVGLSRASDPGARRWRATQWRGDPAHHDVRRARLADRLLPRALRPGPQLDRRSPRRSPSDHRTAARRPAAPRPLALVRRASTTSRWPTRWPSSRAVPGRPGHAGGALDGRQGGDGARPAHPELRATAVRRRRRAGRLRRQRRVRRLHRGHARRSTSTPWSAARDADAALEPRRCPNRTVRELPAAEPAARGRRLALAGQPRGPGRGARRASAGWPARRARPTWRRTTGRCSGSRARTPATCAASTTTR